MELKRFLAVNKQTKKIIIGLWEHVCDLDKRIWNVREWSTEPKKPIARIKVLGGWKDIYNLEDLIGYHIGGAG